MSDIEDYADVLFHLISEIVESKSIKEIEQRITTFKNTCDEIEEEMKIKLSLEFQKMQSHLGDLKKINEYLKIAGKEEISSITKELEEILDITSKKLDYNQVELIIEDMKNVEYLIKKKAALEEKIKNSLRGFSNTKIVNQLISNNSIPLLEIDEKFFIELKKSQLGSQIIIRLGK